jgi:hypothetical protein
MKKLKYQLIFSILIYSLLNTSHALSPTQALAITMQGPNYILHQGDLNMSSGLPKNNQYKLKNTLSPTSPKATGTNYIIDAGFPYILPSQDFSLTLSQTLLDFGILSATNPVTRTTTLSLFNQTAPGYQIFAYENHPLRLDTSETIPDTTCDNGACTQTVSSLWTNTLTYGFGYRCDNISTTPCPDDFQPNYYRQISDLTKAETPAPILTGTTQAKTIQAKLTFKLNTSKNQAKGQYKNTITIIAVPTY